MKYCALESLYLPRDDFRVKKNELDFVSYLESSGDSLEWWFKQGIGREYFGVHYINTTTQKSAIFYPDWIVKLKNGSVLIVDTKMGQPVRIQKVEPKRWPRAFHYLEHLSEVALS